MSFSRAPTRGPTHPAEHEGPLGEVLAIPNQQVLGIAILGNANPNGTHTPEENGYNPMRDFLDPVVPEESGRCRWFPCRPCHISLLALEIAAVVLVALIIAVAVVGILNEYRIHPPAKSTIRDPYSVRSPASPRQTSILHTIFRLLYVVTAAITNGISTSISAFYPIFKAFMAQLCLNSIPAVISLIDRLSTVFPTSKQIWRQCGMILVPDRCTAAFFGMPNYLTSDHLRQSIALSWYPLFKVLAQQGMHSAHVDFKDAMVEEMMEIAASPGAFEDFTRIEKLDRSLCDQCQEMEMLDGW